MARYSVIAMEHFQKPRNTGVLEEYDYEGLAQLTGQTPFVRIYLRLRGETIERASFTTFGCAAAIAAGSMLTELIIGCSLADSLTISSDKLDQELGGLPAERRFCAHLAVAALRSAVCQARGVDSS